MITVERFLRLAVYDANGPGQPTDFDDAPYKHRDVKNLTRDQERRIARYVQCPVAELRAAIAERRCRNCGCTDMDCSQCIEKTGHPCRWVAEDLCSACV